MAARTKQATLTDMQQAFVNEYLKDLNGRQAAIRAGYSPDSADVQASKMLRTGKVSDEVERQMAARSARTGISQDRVITELAKIAFFNPSNVADLNTGEIYEDATEEDMSCVKGVKTKTFEKEQDGQTMTTSEREIQFQDKLRALDMLGKHLGMWDKNAQNNISIVVPVFSGEDDLED